MALEDLAGGRLSIRVFVDIALIRVDELAIEVICNALV